jgi:hypothetical protein
MSRDPFAKASARRMAIFGHPGHELAILGVIQRYRPDIVIITDGGSASRVQQSRDGLASIGMLDRATYLNYAEESFYAALLDQNLGHFAAVVDRLRSLIARYRPEQVFCDAIEFYNPVHDISLPIVRAAIGQASEVTLYEVPLVYQKVAAGEAYEIQRVPPPLAAVRVTHTLSPLEVDRKAAALDQIYTSLHDQAGPILRGLSRDHLGLEEMASATEGLPSPASTGRALRYEWRARRLLQQGTIRRAITLHEHFVPIATRLMAAKAFQNR